MILAYLINYFKIMIFIHVLTVNPARSLVLHLRPQSHPNTGWGHLQHWSSRVYLPSSSRGVNTGSNEKQSCVLHESTRPYTCISIILLYVLDHSLLSNNLAHIYSILRPYKSINPYRAGKNLLNSSFTIALSFGPINIITSSTSTNRIQIRCQY